jgi:protoheme IX farnesyltransferase
MSSTLARVDGQAELRSSGLMGTINDYYELTKPRIIGLLLVTTYAAMLMAQRGLPALPLTLWTLLGGALAAASAGAFNCVFDRDIDSLMRRTMSRPIPMGRISPVAGTLFAAILGTLAFSILYVAVTPLAAWLSLAGNIYYVVIYTMWLKRLTPLNIVIGGAAGAVPPLVGWVAVSHSIGAPALALFWVIFLWTPPHFWALALMTETDYHKANVPMLPNVKGVPRTKREIVAYTVVLLAFSLVLFPLHIFNLTYFIAALILNGIFLWDAIGTLRDDGRTWARRTFIYSILYLGLMCVAMVADRVFPSIPF